MSCRTAVASAAGALLAVSLAAAVAQHDGGRAARRAVVATTTTTATATVSAADGPHPTIGPGTTAPPAALAPAKVLVAPHGVVVRVLSQDAAGYRVSTPCDAVAVVPGGTAVNSADVVLDAGHGGSEAGATGSGGLAEKTPNLAVVQHARTAIERAGFGVVLTRTGDYRMTLAARTEIVKVLHPRAFVSVHHNAEPDGPFDRPGTETYYQIASPASKRLAGLVYEEVVRALSAYQVQWMADTDAGAKYRPNSSGDDYYAVLRRTHGTPTALAELAFVSNPPEEALLSRADVQLVEGEAVARGIVRFLTTKEPGSGFTTPYPRTEPAGGGGGSAGCVDPPL